MTPLLNDGVPPSWGGVPYTSKTSLHPQSGGDAPAREEGTAPALPPGCSKDTHQKGLQEGWGPRKLGRRGLHISTPLQSLSSSSAPPDVLQLRQASSHLGLLPHGSRANMVFMSPEGGSGLQTLKCHWLRNVLHNPLLHALKEGAGRGRQVGPWDS